MNKKTLNHKELPCVSSDKLGLDPRASSCVYVGDEFIAVALHDRNSMMYYGGFQYHDECHEEDGFVFFDVDHGNDGDEGCRVKECVKFYENLCAKADADWEKFSKKLDKFFAENNY